MVTRLFSQRSLFSVSRLVRPRNQTLRNISASGSQGRETQHLGAVLISSKQEGGRIGGVGGCRCWCWRCCWWWGSSFQSAIQSDYFCTLPIFCSDCHASVLIAGCSRLTATYQSSLSAEGLAACRHIKARRGGGELPGSKESIATVLSLCVTGADTKTKELLLLLLPTRCASHPLTAQRESSGTRQPCVSLRLHWRSMVALPNTHTQTNRGYAENC